MFDSILFICWLQITLAGLTYIRVWQLSKKATFRKLLQFAYTRPPQDDFLRNTFLRMFWLRITVVMLFGNSIIMIGVIYGT